MNTEKLKELMGTKTFKRFDILKMAKNEGFEARDAFKFLENECERVSHGVYKLQESDVAPAMAVSASKVEHIGEDVVKVDFSPKTDLIEVPNKIPEYVKLKFSKDLESIVGSKMFYPTYISGLSGNGKTLMVEQACANTNRKFIRVQISPETDELDLIGGFQLIDGNTIFVKGPVIRAMEEGAVCLIDEIDRGSNTLMCLQGILEGQPYLIKKTGEVLYPQPGFNIIATANTKGRGSFDGKYSAATILDEAFLERFIITYEQEFPTRSQETRILTKHAEKYGLDTDNNFIELLIDWSTAIRKTFYDGGIDELISTRRLCHIIQTQAIFNDRVKSIRYCISRFDEEIAQAMLQLYKDYDATAQETEEDDE